MVDKPSNAMYTKILPLDEFKAIVKIKRTISPNCFSFSSLHCIFGILFLTFALIYFISTILLTTIYGSVNLVGIIPVFIFVTIGSLTVSLSRNYHRTRAHICLTMELVIAIIYLLSPVTLYFSVPPCTQQIVNVVGMYLVAFAFLGHIVFIRKEILELCDNSRRVKL